ncbi:MAG: GNAT family N-acetyltransferase [Candidatus Bathyarchaeia archaeon]
MGAKWLIRAYETEDEIGIWELCKALYPETESDWEQWLRWWRWMYKENPAGAPSIWIAEHGTKIVGQYPLVPFDMKVGDQVLKVLQNIDVMTHPDYRHQGIFSALERRALDEAAKAGLHITFGFPNAAAYPGHMKSGWFDLGTMQVGLKSLNWSKAVRLKVRNKLLSTILGMGAAVAFDKVLFRTRKLPPREEVEVDVAARFDDRVSVLWGMVSGEYPIAVARNRQYLNWRYGSPGNSYRIFVAREAGDMSGYIVLEHKKHDDLRLSYIFDLIATSEATMHGLLSMAVESCRSNETDAILYPLIANETYRHVLKNNGFIFWHSGHFCACSSSLHVPKEFLAKRENWFVQIGDSDMR